MDGLNRDGRFFLILAFLWFPVICLSEETVDISEWLINNQVDFVEETTNKISESADYTYESSIQLSEESAPVSEIDLLLKELGDYIESEQETSGTGNDIHLVQDDSSEASMVSTENETIVSGDVKYIVSKSEAINLLTNGSSEQIYSKVDSITRGIDSNSAYIFLQSNKRLIKYISKNQFILKRLVSIVDASPELKREIYLKMKRNKELIHRVLGKYGIDMEKAKQVVRDRDISQLKDYSEKL